MGDTVIVETPVDEVVSIVTQGPQGPSGSEAATLTTTGDLLYRDALANDRLPIGSEGQVLKVASGLPAWGNESGAVTSVNGENGAVVLDAADVGAATSAQGTLADTAVQPGDLATVATSGDYDDLTNKPASFTPSTHASTHATAGSDPVFDQDLNTDDSVDFQEMFVGGGGEGFTINSSGLQHTFGFTLDAEGDSIVAGSGLLGIAGDVTILDGALSFSGAGAETDKATTRTNLGLGNSATLDTGTTAGTVAEGDHTHELNALDATGATDGHVLTADGAGGAAFEAIPSTAINDLSNVSAAAPSDNDVLVYDNATSTWVAEAPAAGGVSAIGTSAADVFSVSGSDLVADDGGLINSANPAVVWDDASGKLVYQNPLERPSGAGSMFIGLAPSTTALGTDAVNVQTTRSGATIVASGSNSVSIGHGQADGAHSVAIGSTATGTTTRANGNGAIAIGAGSGGFARAQGNASVAIGGSKPAGGGSETIADGTVSTNINAYTTSATGSTAIGYAGYATLRGQFSFGGMGARSGNFANDGATLLQWKGTTTNDTQTEIFLDGASNQRAVVAANRMWAGELYIAAVQSTSAKALFLHRTFAIKRDGSNNTALVGSVQTVGTDQDTGSPTWSVSIDANDSTESLRIRVTGAASETVYWTASGWINEVG